MDGLDSSGNAPGVESRTDNFLGGAVGGTPEFASAQQHTSHSYTPTSVMDKLTMSGNGYSAQDRSRMLLGGSMLPTANGASSETYQASSLLTSPYRPLG